MNYGAALARAAAESLEGVELTPERLAWLDGLAFEQRPLGNMERPVKRSVGDLGAVALPERFVLFVAQVHDDTQIDFYSPHFPTVEDAIRYVHSEIRAANADGGGDLRLVVKEHPQDYKRADYQTLRRDLGDAIFLQHVDNEALLRRSEAVVTVNSSMGFRRSCAIAPSPPSGRRCTRCPASCGGAPEEGALRALLPGLIRGEGLDRDRQRRLLVALHERCLVDLPAYDATESQYAGVAERLWSVLGAPGRSRPAERTPSA